MRVSARKYAEARARMESRADVRDTVRDMIDRDSPVPVWQQVAEILRERIRAGEITRRLPGERSLQQETGVAPQTIRRAIRELEAEGLVVTVPGRGSFVKGKGESP